jgi:hypothetical protein
MQPKVKALLGGVAPFTPLYRLVFPHKGGGGTATPLCCYSPWLTHLRRLHEAGMSAVPSGVAELGPGDSIGVGLAALLSGAIRLVALDIVPYADSPVNQVLLDGLVDVFRSRANVQDGSPFPSGILPDAVLERTLGHERIDLIRQALHPDGVTSDRAELSIRYLAPWSDRRIIAPASLDLVVSQAVLEHVDALSEAYDNLAHWLAPGGWMSHCIDFKCHQLTRDWNGHWACAEWEWKILRGRKTYLINPYPLAVHLDNLARNGFRSSVVGKVTRRDGITAAMLSKRFRRMSDDDLHTAGACIVGRRPEAITLGYESP